MHEPRPRYAPILKYDGWANIASTEEQEQWVDHWLEVLGKAAVAQATVDHSDDYTDYDYLQHIAERTQQERP